MLSVSPPPANRDTERAGTAGIRPSAPGQSKSDPNLFAPVDGTFNGPTAAALTRWKEE